MATECLELAIHADSRHAASYNNLGVLEMKNGNLAAARVYFQTAASIDSYSYEPHFNSSYLSYNVMIYQLFWWFLKLKIYLNSNFLYFRMETYKLVTYQYKNRWKHIQRIEKVKNFSIN